MWFENKRRIIFQNHFSGIKVQKEEKKGVEGYYVLSSQFNYQNIFLIMGTSAWIEIDICIFFIK